METEVNQIAWNIIDKYFEDNPNALVRHHLDSFNDFYKNDIFRIFKEMNPITIMSKRDDATGEFMSKCYLYLGGKNGDLVYFAKPVIYDDKHSHYMFPNEARLRNMSYSMAIHYDVEVVIQDTLAPGELPRAFHGGNQENTEAYANIVDPVQRHEFSSYKGGKININGEPDMYDNYHKTMMGGEEPEHIREYGEDIKGGAKEKKLKIKQAQKLSPAEIAKVREEMEKTVKNNIQTREFKLEKIYLGRFPIMVQSDFCILSGMPREIRYNFGECKNDVGGYFIIDGKEKTVVPQEKFGDNMLRVEKSNGEPYIYLSEIKSVSENISKPIRTLRVGIVGPTTKYTNLNIVVDIPNVRKPVPIFIVFRALGVISDKDIITMCMLDIEKNADLLDEFVPSIHDAGPVMTQDQALRYIAELTKTKTINNVLSILTDYFLPHIGEMNYIEKAYFLGYMVQRLIYVYKGIDTPVDRDSFRYKRIELVGDLLYQLFREYWKMQIQTIFVSFEKRLYFNQAQYEDLATLIMENYRTIFKESKIVEDGFRKAFKGNWGATAHTKRIGVVQDLNRLSFNSALSHLRKTNLSTIGDGAKVIGPRLLNATQWGLIDPIDTPDGGNIGLHKSLSILTHVSRNLSREPMIKWLREKVNMKRVEECGPLNLSTMTKILVNGYWAGSVIEPFDAIEKIKIFRRNSLIPFTTSIGFDMKQNVISIFTDGGRLMRPLFFYDELTKKWSYDGEQIETLLRENQFYWSELVGGFNIKKDEYRGKLNDTAIYELNEMYKNIDSELNPLKLKRFIEKRAVLEYVDPNEEETSLILLAKQQQTDKYGKATHKEIHDSTVFGMMCNLVIYPHHNPATRNSFSCGQSKQAVSMYHTNFNARMDKTAVVLNQGQVPLVKSRYLEHINHEENPYGENAIVAIMCYTGYNVEDAILINEGAIQRGLFRTTYFSTYEAHEERTKMPNGEYAYKKFVNMETSSQPVLKLKDGHDYSKLDAYGLVKEGTEMTDKTIVIGCALSASGKEYMVDDSKTTKKGQLGIVDKTFITDGAEGSRIAKVRIREQRIPSYGDKMASRSGQKGTVGQVIPEKDMPFTKDGLRPDMIINPHAIPTRMTIGQLVECIVGKVSCIQGGHGDCTAFEVQGKEKIGAYGEILTKHGYHQSGNEILYNGMTGEQIDSQIFIGPTYYMRLKHMVKDKINFRATGPRTQLTRQPVSGRANDGGLRIGEMERDVLISHGITAFLDDSMLKRGDQYYMAVCNKSGGIAIYNPDRNLFISPMTDGPVKFVDSFDKTQTNVLQVTKYGRSFSVIRVPYVFKLLLQELMTMGITMRLITEDNIHQFDNMCFSNNISLLSGIEFANIDDIIKNINQQIDNYKNDKTDKNAKWKALDEKAEREKKEAEKPVIESPTDSLGKSIEPSNYIWFTDEDTGEERYGKISHIYPDGNVDVLVFDEASGQYLSPPVEVEPTNIVKIEKHSGLKPVIPQTPEGSPETESSKSIVSSWTPSEESNASQSGGAVNVFSPSETRVRREDGFAIGDSVWFRGDFKSERIWTIIRIDNKWITIKTMDFEGLPTEDSAIRVVSVADIHKVDPAFQMRAPVVSEIPAINAIPPGQATFCKEPVQFAPVINVVTGNNNEIEQPVKPQVPINPVAGLEPIMSAPLIRKKVGFGEPNMNTNVGSEDTLATTNNALSTLDNVKGGFVVKKA